MTYSTRTDQILQAIFQATDPNDVHFEDGPIRVVNADVIHPTIQHEETMTAPTREEFDAKLETMEVRMDGRVASIEAKIDGFMGRMEDRFIAIDGRMTGIESTMRDTQASVGSLKSTTIVTAIGAVLTIVLGVAAFNSTVLSNMVSSFESGKNTSAAQAEVKRQSEETAALLKQIQQSIDATKK